MKTPTLKEQHGIHPAFIRLPVNPINIAVPAIKR